MRNVIAALSCAVLVGPVAAQDAQQRIEWNRPFAPFRVIGNVYYVGTEGLSAFLIADPRGHVLIDGGLRESAPLIRANIERLGFRITDVRYLLLNHSHFDHAGGLAELKRASGAKMVASAEDARDLAAGRTIGRPELEGFAAMKVDRVARDGSWLRVGGTVMRAHLTPGHTRGCTSWETTANEAGKAYRILFACSLTVAGQKLVGDPVYRQAAADFRRTFATLGHMKVDVFLNFHPEFFRMAEKRAKLAVGDRLAFVDAGELAVQVKRAEAGFAKALAQQGGSQSTPVRQ